MTEEAPKFVRPAGPRDVAFISHLQARAMTELLRVALPVAPPYIAEEALNDAWKTTLATSVAGAGTLIAEDNGEAVGFVSYHPVRAPGGEDTATEILALEVSEGHRKAGHGSRLLAAVADVARVRAPWELHVWLVPEDSARMRFFQSAGFAPSGLRRTLDVTGETVVEHQWHAQVAA